MLEVKMFEIFGPELALAAFRWVDDELSALPPETPFAQWWSSRREEHKSRLPDELTHGSVTLPLPDDVKRDLSRFVMLEELLYELTNGPADGEEAWTGDILLGTLPPLDGGWGNHQLWASDVLRWFRGWRDEMELDLGAMIADVQLLTGAPDVEVAPGVRMRVNPEYLAELGDADAESRPPLTVLSLSDGQAAPDFRPLRDFLGRVLIVDPHPGVGKGLVRFLRARGFFVVGTAKDGAEAIQLVNELRLDAVITEINLPVLGGLMMTGIIREQFPNVPVIILTVYDDEVFRNEAMSAGAAAYLVKSDTQPDEVAEMLHDVIEKGRRRSHKHHEAPALSPGPDPAIDVNRQDKEERDARALPRVDASIAENNNQTTRRRVDIRAQGLQASAHVDASKGQVRSFAEKLLWGRRQPPVFPLGLPNANVVGRSWPVYIGCMVWTATAPGQVVDYDPKGTAFPDTCLVCGRDARPDTTVTQGTVTRGYYKCRLQHASGELPAWWTDWESSEVVDRHLIFTPDLLGGGNTWSTVELGKRWGDEVGDLFWELRPEEGLAIDEQWQLLIVEVLDRNDGGRNWFATGEVVETGAPR